MYMRISSCYVYSSNTPISAIIQTHRKQYYSPPYDSFHRITVRRKKIFEDALLYFRKGIPQDKGLKVTFVGEPAVDDGGPLREFFHLLIPTIGIDNPCFSQGVMALSLQLIILSSMRRSPTFMSDRCLHCQ